MYEFIIKLFKNENFLLIKSSKIHFCNNKYTLIFYITI